MRIGLIALLFSEIQKTMCAHLETTHLTVRIGTCPTCLFSKCVSGVLELVVSKKKCKPEMPRAQKVNANRPAPKRSLGHNSVILTINDDGYDTECDINDDVNDDFQNNANDDFHKVSDDVNDDVNDDGNDDDVTTTSTVTSKTMPTMTSTTSATTSTITPTLTPTTSRKTSTSRVNNNDDVNDDVNDVNNTIIHVNKC